ncbi:hypothetical protein JTB14_009894 [Gonioctena quinquepunctata]|nr:hypothetical protein JTB14_009894 [Gonioctena quinquepunctata]
MKFVGYSEELKAYRLSDIGTCRITINRNVRFIENDKLNGKDDEAKEVIMNISNQGGKENNTDGKLEQEETENQMNCDETVESDEDLKTQGADEKKEVEIKNYLKLEEYDEPKTFEEAMEMRNRRKWMKAMEDGIESMRECQAWELVKCPGDKRIVDCKWIYKIKSDPSNGTIRYRTRLVLKVKERKMAFFIYIKGAILKKS